ncbi:MAG TPA: glycosyltransferase family 2 protein [Thermodesulfobacteriota bacterium]|nr:glycosyltransferase family 2 protein [Thermodesulfobacteriota bacterium]
MDRPLGETSSIDISVVVPVYNEEENLPVLIPQIAEVLRSLKKTYEMIFVDDGSKDRSRQILKEVAAQYPQIRILGFKKNCGETAAGTAGIKEARGRIVITIDADLQNDPTDIPRMLDYLKEYDMVTGWRQKREDSWVKRITSQIANRIRNSLSGEEIQDSGCTFRAYKRECLRDIKLYKGMHRFLPTLVKMEGYRVIEIPIAHHPRKFGVSKYTTWNRMWRAFVDLLAVKWMKSRHIHYEIEERV